MAFTASAVWEVQTGGSDNNGGGFDTGVAGFPTDGTVDANTGNTSAPVFSSASYNFVAGDVGAWIYIKSGTNSIPGWYQITAVGSNKATLNATIGAAVLAAGAPTTAVGIATVGTPTSLTWGIDYSQSGAARIAFTDMVIGGTTTQFTSAANPVGKNFVGNTINVVSGTGFTVQCVAVVSTSGTTATCDKSLGTGGSTGGSGNLGGAFASPALPFSVGVNGNTFWIKSGSYSVTTASVNTANGRINFTQTSARCEGYGSVRGDVGTAPVITASGISTFTMFGTPSGGSDVVRNITIDCAGLTAARGFSIGSALGDRLTVKNATNFGYVGNGSNSILVRCIATGCSTQAAFANAICLNCVAYANTVTGFSAGVAFINCLAYNNTGASTDGFNIASLCAAVNCIAYSNGRHGFSSSGAAICVTNCIAESNTGTGISLTGAAAAIQNCGVYLNGTNAANSGATSKTETLITLTASAFVNAAAGNFALNAAAGGGALLRAAGIPGVTPDGLSTGYLDIGAIQSKALATIGVGFQGGMVD